MVDKQDILSLQKDMTDDFTMHCNLLEDDCLNSNPRNYKEIITAND